MRVALGLGSNLGERAGHLRAAAEGLGPLGESVARSSIWETAPIGPDQPQYLNAVVVIDSVLGPSPLLEACMALEVAAGRVRRKRWGPRELDIDILLYGDAVIDAKGLRVPHPRMAERRFVLEPLAEAWPGVEVPGCGPVEALLDRVRDQYVVCTELEW